MRHVWTDVDRIHRTELILISANSDLATPADADHDMRMQMAFEAGVSACIEFEVPQMKSDALTALSDEHLSRCAAEVTPSMR